MVTMTCKHRTMKTVTPAKVLSHPGFSLAEVAIAVAIAALGFITLLGLLPNVLDSMRKSGSDIVLARIYQQMLNEAQQTEWGGNPTRTFGGWTGLAAQQGEATRRYYDDQGIPISPTDSGFDLRLSFVAQAFYESTPVQLPGEEASSGSKEARADMVKVTIKVAPGATKDYVFGSQPANEISRTQLVARQW